MKNGNDRGLTIDRISFSGGFFKPPCGADFNGLVLSDKVKVVADICKSSK